MTDKEILGELKICYENLYDIRENGCADHCDGQLENHLIKSLEVAKHTIEDIYSEFYKTLDKESLRVKCLELNNDNKVYISSNVSGDYESDACDLTCADTDYYWYKDQDFLTEENINTMEINKYDLIKFKQYAEQLAKEMKLPIDSYSKSTRDSYVEKVYYTYKREVKADNKLYLNFIDSAYQGNLSSWYANELNVEKTAPLQWRQNVIKKIEKEFVNFYELGDENAIKIKKKYELNVFEHEEEKEIEM